jgi:hypothetical protein
MKKFLGLLLAIVLLSFSAIAQNSAVAPDKTLSATETGVVYVGAKTTDNIGVAGDSIWTFTINKSNISKTLPYVNMKLDRIATGGSIQIILYGKPTKNATYAGLDTVSWNKGTATTVIELNPTVYGMYDYYLVKVVSSGATIKGRIEYMDFKIVQE